MIILCDILCKLENFFFPLGIEKGRLLPEFFYLPLAFLLFPHKQILTNHWSREKCSNARVY